MIIDAELYTISVRKENIDGDVLYVARVVEFPDVEEYGDTFAEARELAVDTIETAYELCMEKNIPFPEPADFASQPQASGRVTLRMPKSLHANLIKVAECEEISLNQYIVSSLSIQYGQCQMSESILHEMKSNFLGIKVEIQKYQKVAATYLFKEHLEVFTQKEKSNWVASPTRLQWTS
jgi:predicted HicB family RNase H-like nuclease